MMRRRNAVLCILLVTGIMLCGAISAAAMGRGAFADDFVGARASVFGEAFVAVADDANALRWNPAGLTQLLQPEFTSSHANIFSLGGYLNYSDGSASINKDFIGFVLPNHIAPVGVSFLNLGTNGMPLADKTGAIMNSFGSYAERTLTLSAGKRFEMGSFGLSAGCNINYFFLDAYSNNSGLGLDAGFLLETPGILPELGLMLEGLFMDALFGDNGPTVPSEVDLALAFSPVRPLKLVGGLGKTSGGSITQYSAGMELVLLRLAPLNVSFMTGYRSLGSMELGSVISDASVFSVGASTRLWRYKLDYAYEQHSELGDSHLVTFGILKNSPEDFHLKRGRQAFEQLDDATAILELEEVVYLAPRNIEVYHLLALTYERMRQKDEAIRVLQRIQSLNYDYFMEQKLDQMMKDIQEQD